MKKIILTLALGLIVSLTAVQAQNLNVSINIGSQPAWGPVGYDYVDYYYMPDINCYYGVNTGMYVFLNGGRWVTAPYLPDYYRRYDFYNLYKVVLVGPDPWLYNNRHRHDYARFVGRPPQPMIRYSNDRRYAHSRRNEHLWYNNHGKPNNHGRPGNNQPNNNRPNNNRPNNNRPNDNGRPQDQGRPNNNGRPQDNNRPGSNNSGRPNNGGSNNRPNQAGVSQGRNSQQNNTVRRNDNQLQRSSDNKSNNNQRSSSQKSRESSSKGRESSEKNNRR